MMKIERAENQLCDCGHETCNSCAAQAAPAFRVEKKILKTGIEVKIFRGETLIGKRKSGHAYRFALLVKHCQASALQHAKENLVAALREAAKYQSIQDGDVAARTKAITRFGFASVSQSIADGDYGTWAAQQREIAERLQTKIARLESGPQPEFDEVFIASWHHERRNVPSVQPYNVFVAVVEIPE